MESRFLHGGARAPDEIAKGFGARERALLTSRVARFWLREMCKRAARRECALTSRSYVARTSMHDAKSISVLRSQSRTGSFCRGNAARKIHD
jgi:hypothetical protein